MPKRILFLAITISAGSLGFSQVTDVDPAMKRRLAAEKQERFRQLRLAEVEATEGQDDYDVVHYRLDLHPDPEASYLTGTVSITGTVTAPVLDRIDLNLWAGMTITDVRNVGSGGAGLSVQREGDLCTVLLDRTHTQGEAFRIAISYGGRPQDAPYRSFHFGSKDGSPMIWTLSQPFGARAWWPCKDLNSDKADSVDLHITVPSELIVASNGVLRSTSESGNETTYWWHEGYPIATYLVSIAAHPFEVHYDEYVSRDGAQTMPIEFYTFAGNYERYEEINVRVKDMIACFSDLFGEYPFIDEKYGHADISSGGGAMEHQTCTSFGTWNEPVYAHELAHQWWGDMVTCATFHHIWLNEGFAEYCEALWYEYANPGYTASEYLMTYQTYYGSGTVYVEDPENDNIFDVGLSYWKGSWVVHMLRHVVGEEAFFAILRALYGSENHRFKTITTEEFQDLCESISGLNLEKFFHQWIHEEYFPKYSYSWNWTGQGSGYEVVLDLRQNQLNHLFWMPVDVTVTTSSGETTFVAWDSLAHQQFAFSVDSEPVHVEIDANDWILKWITEDFDEPGLDEGLLLVNGVDWNTYQQEIRDAYENRAFWGEFPISFWDHFDPPQEGYPSTLPEPLGQGRVPADILQRFSSVVWIGNDFSGDLASWLGTPILPYLRAGGNVLLISRLGQSFIDYDLKEYLGIRWEEGPRNTIQEAVSEYPGLVDMDLLGLQTFNAVFNTTLNSAKSTLLFRETVSFGVDRGLGVWHRPEGGGTHDPDGGQFVFLSGRGYRYGHQGMRSNCQFILENFFGESPTEVRRVSDGVTVDGFVLEPNHPNPFNSGTDFIFQVDAGGTVRLVIYNLLGQEIRVLADDVYEAGRYRVRWDGKRDSGMEAPSGIYLSVLEGRSAVRTKKITLLR